jgi:hypothetical protein
VGGCVGRTYQPTVHPSCSSKFGHVATARPPTYYPNVTGIDVGGLAAAAGTKSGRDNSTAAAGAAAGARARDTASTVDAAAYLAVATSGNYRGLVDGPRFAGGVYLSLTRS